MIIFYSTVIEGTTAVLEDQEAKHCTRVLRKREGDSVYVTNGKGSLYEGPIAYISKKEVRIEPLKLLEQQDVKVATGIAIAPTKTASRFEWFLEKAVEIGITDIFPVITKRTEKSRLKMNRLEGILISAMKQSKNFHLPQLHEPVAIEKFEVPNKYIHRYIAHCMDAESHLLNIYEGVEPGMVLIGPEGDFTESEVEKWMEAGFKETNLGQSRLRTETAGVVATHLLQLAISTQK